MRFNTSKVNRVEIIDHRKDTNKEVRYVALAGPAYGEEDSADVGISLQDEERTLKIFITDKEEKEQE